MIKESTFGEIREQYDKWAIGYDFDAERWEYSTPRKLSERIRNYLKSGMRILDLGCGTGRLAIGSALLGAQEIVGVDIDSDTIEVALTNAEKLNIKEKTQWITADITAIKGKFDTVLQNPPFGVQRKKADREFLKKALEVGKKIYSLHKSTRDISGYRKSGKQNIKPLPSSPSSFLKQFITAKGGQISSVHTIPITIPHMFKFHRKQKHHFYVDLYVIKKIQPNMK